MDGAYGRVSNPQRFDVLHGEARLVADRLTARFQVDRAEGLDLDPELVKRVDSEALIRLVPAGDVAPVTLTLTRFPGLLVRFGRWHVEAYPACGCDACDDDPGDLLAKFHDDVDAVVRGGFHEELTAGRHPWLRHRFGDETGPGAGGGGQRLDRRQARTLGAPARLTWRPWPPRTPERP